MIVLTGPVGGEGGQFLFRDRVDRVLKPLPEWHDRAFLVPGWRGRLLLLLRIQCIQGLADNLIRRAITRLGYFLLDARI